jgi:hypothetical protein
VQSAWRRGSRRVVVRARSGKEASASCCRGAWRAMILRRRLHAPWPSRAIVRRCHQRCAVVGMAPSGIATLANPDLSQVPNPLPARPPSGPPQPISSCQWTPCWQPGLGDAPCFRGTGDACDSPSANLPPADKNTNQFGCLRLLAVEQFGHVGCNGNVLLGRHQNTSGFRQLHALQLALPSGCAATMPKPRSTCGWKAYSSCRHVLYMYNVCTNTTYVCTVHTVHT